jgi:hypothetical protein
MSENVTSGFRERVDVGFALATALDAEIAPLLQLAEKPAHRGAMNADISGKALMAKTWGVFPQ